MINEIQIRNFKCFVDQSISCNNLTVFAGINGVGKSAAIQALLLFRQTFDKIRQFAIKDKGETESIYDSLKITIKEAYHINLGNSKEITSVITDSDTIELATVVDGQLVPFRYVASTETSEPSIDFTIEEDILKTDVLKNASDSIFAETFHYLIAERVGPRDFQLISGQEFLSTGYIGILNELYHNSMLPETKKLSYFSDKTYPFQCLFNREFLR